MKSNFKLGRLALLLLSRPAKIIKDPRQRGLCAPHRHCRKAGERITGVPPDPQTRSRAIFFGMQQLALHLTRQVDLFTPDGRPGTMSRPWMRFLMASNMFIEDDETLKLLYHPDFLDQGATRGDQMPKTLHQDALAAAKEWAKDLYPQDALLYQQAVDADVHDILSEAGERLYVILTDKDFINKDHGLFSKEYKEKNQKRPLLEQKRQLVKAILANPTHQDHAWRPYRSGVQCRQRKTRLHCKSTIDQLKQEPQEPCSRAIPRKKTNKLTRMELIDKILEEGPDQLSTDHELWLDKAYLRCKKCRTYLLASTNEEADSSPCHHGPLAPAT